MSAEPDDAPGRPDPEEVLLDGPGPFQLPICTDLKEIAVGESLAVLRLETIDGQRVDVPVPIGMLVELGDACEEALHHALRSREGPGVQ